MALPYLIISLSKVVHLLYFYIIISTISNIFVWFSAISKLFASLASVLYPKSRHPINLSPIGKKVAPVQTQCNHLSKKLYLLFLKNFIIKFNFVNSRKMRSPNFTAKQVFILNQAFEKNSYPKTSVKTELAQKTDLTKEQVDLWFIRERQRGKKEAKISQNKDI
jgi:hypothetical protein